MTTKTPSTIKSNEPRAGTRWVHPDTRRYYVLRPDPDWFDPSAWEWHNGELVRTVAEASPLPAAKGKKPKLTRPLVLFEVWPGSKARKIPPRAVRAMIGWGELDFARAGWRRVG